MGRDYRLFSMSFQSDSFVYIANSKLDPFLVTVGFFQGCSAIGLINEDLHLLGPVHKAMVSG